MNRLVRLEQIERKAEPLDRLNSVPILECDPDEASEVDHICRIIEEQLLVPMRMAVSLD